MKFTLKYAENSLKNVSKLIPESETQLKQAILSFENPLTDKKVKMCVLSHVH